MSGAEADYTLEPVGQVRWQRHDWVVWEEQPYEFFIVVPTSGGDERVRVDMCRLCEGWVGLGDGITLHGFVMCNECSDAIMNLEHERFTGKYITWPNESPPSTAKKATIKPSLRREVYERDEYGCRYCGARKNLSLDHVMPESQGGETTAENLVTCCKSCNSRKHARTPEEAGMELLPPPEAPS